MPLTPETRRELSSDLLLALADAVVAISKRCPADRDIEAACGRIMAIVVRLRENRDPGRQVKDPPGFPPPAPGRVVARTPPTPPTWDTGPPPSIMGLAKEMKARVASIGQERAGDDSVASEVGDDEQG